MKNYVKFTAMALALVAFQFQALAQGTAFVYQGHLNDAGGPANGLYDLTFSLYDAGSNGNQVGPALTNLSAGVTNGLFSATLDFGPGVFTGINLWLDISVQTNGGAGFTELTPRQALTPVPYAILAGNAAAYEGPVGDSQLTGNIAKLNGNQTFSGTVNFNGPSNAFVGSFNGNGLGLSSLPISALMGQASTVAVWGLNGNLQTNMPPGLNGSSILAIAGGAYHSLAVKSDGTVVAWGLNGNGQTNVPGGLAGVMAVAAGYSHSLALKGDGTVVGWGDNIYGESTAPAGLNNVVAVAAGNFISLALKKDGTVTAWGTYSTGSIPFAFQSNLVAISASKLNNYVLGLKSNGTVVAWNMIAPPVGLSNVVAIAVSANNGGLALKKDGTIVTWGVLAPAPTTNNVVAIAAGIDFGLALKTDGTVMTWGDSNNGLPSYAATLSNVTALAAGGYHALVLRGTGYAPAPLARLDQLNIFTGVDSFTNPNNSYAGDAAGLTNVQASALASQLGTVVVWGNNAYFQTNVPPGLSITSFQALAGGYGHNLALKTDGTVVAWGLNNNGQTNVPAGLSGVIGIAAGYYQSLALKSDGTVTAWGDITYGATSVPAGLNNVVAISGGQYSSMALKADGTAVAWGSSSYTNIPAAFQSNIVAISTFGICSLALKSNGKVVAWNIATPPSNLSNVVAVAALGNGGGVALKNDSTIVTWGNQTATPFTNNIAGIAAGYNFAVAVRKDGTVLEWGNLGYGLPSFASTLSSVSLVAAGYDHALAVRGAGVFVPVHLAHLDRFNGFTGPNWFSNPSNTFAGNGAALTALNASNLATGTVAEARLSTNVALLNASQTFAGPNVFSHPGNVFLGAFSGNGASLTSLNAAQLFGTVPLPQLPDVVLTNNNAASVTLNGVFSGDGGGMTNIHVDGVVGGLTTNMMVLVPGGGTNILCFTNGVLRAVQ